jgi:nucleoside-diphosphate-sugar epimerase
MRVFLAGASGVMGRRLVPLLLDDGHTVAGLTRSQPDAVAALGAEPVVADAFDPEALTEAVAAVRPDVVVHQLTNLPDAREELEGAADANFRIRTEGTRNLLAAAGSVKTVAQSTAFPARVEELERAVLGADGVILRYGYWYGPGTWYADTMPPEPRVHIDEAARRTVEALDAPRGTIITIVERD